jgi:hypothetical protein
MPNINKYTEEGRVGLFPPFKLKKRDRKLFGFLTLIFGAFQPILLNITYVELYALFPNHKDSLGFSCIASALAMMGVCICVAINFFYKIAFE